MKIERYIRILVEFLIYPWKEINIHIMKKFNKFLTFQLVINEKLKWACK